MVKFLFILIKPSLSLIIIKLNYFFHDGYLSFKEIKDGFRAIFLMLGSEGNIDLLSKNMAEQTMVKLNSSSKNDEIKKSNTGNIFSNYK